MPIKRLLPDTELFDSIIHYFLLLFWTLVTIMNINKHYLIFILCCKLYSVSFFVLSRCFFKRCTHIHTPLVIFSCKTKMKVQALCSLMFLVSKSAAAGSPKFRLSEVSFNPFTFKWYFLPLTLCLPALSLIKYFLLAFCVHCFC